MPDLIIEYARICTTNRQWQMEVLSGDFSKTYAVKYGRLYPDEEARQMEDYGWTCTCPAFKFRKKGESVCKHIKDARAHRCAWNCEADPCNRAGHTKGANCCPDCGGSTEVVKVAI